MKNNVYPAPNEKPTIKGAMKPFMAPTFNVPSGVKSRSASLPVSSSVKKKSNVSSGKGLDLIKDKMRSKVQKAKMNVRSATVSKGSGKCGVGNNFCKSKSKF